jgi:hypothetical protein
MNERIQELADQARAEVRADWSKGNKIPYPEAHYAFQRDNDQKFAELIIQECISACATDRLGKTAGAEELINQHFGVEEAGAACNIE